MDLFPPQVKMVMTKDQAAKTTRSNMKTRSFVMRQEPTKFIAGVWPSFNSWENFSQPFIGFSPRSFATLIFFRVNQVAI